MARAKVRAGAKRKARAARATRPRKSQRIALRRENTELQKSSGILALDNAPVEDLESFLVDPFASYVFIERSPGFDELLSARLLGL